MVLLLHNPEAGVWHIAAAPGSAPITSVEGAEDVPPATLAVHVRHARASRYKLSYAIGHFVAGTRVRFVERGRDSTHVLGTVSRAKGTLSFAPQDGLSRGRTVVAYLLDGEGAAVRSLTVAPYSAPGAHS